VSGRGRFIVLEGIDGAGKSTNISFIADWLTARGHAVTTAREPGGPPIAERIRELLLRPENHEMQPETELLLLFAARVQHLRQRIQPALRAGRTVLCERFTASTYAYQGGGRGLAPELIACLEKHLLDSWRPDLTLLLDLPPEDARRRRRGRDRYHDEPDGFLRRVRECYLRRAAEAPGVCRVDAALPLAEVRKAIVGILERSL